MGGRISLRKFSCFSASLLALFAVAANGQPLLMSGDMQLRHDIALLADAGIIRTPTTTWPISWPEILREISSVHARDASGLPEIAALERVREAASRAARLGGSGLEGRVAFSDRGAGLRGFVDSPREDMEIGAGVSWLGQRFAINVNAAAAANAEDGKELRLDGSYAAVRISNWIVSFGAFDRWWGPGWEGSLIVSSNARPAPGVAIDRMHADAPRSYLLRWIGPWRASVALGQLEGSSVDVPDARLFLARVTFRPRQWLEVGLSRSAQWCGAGRPCDLRTFSDLLIGRDNADLGLTSDREPGNQMAGYDIRLRSPWRRLPAAIYLQLIGEDEAGGLPSKFLGLGGVEGWTASRFGSHRWFAEYADTSCSFSRQRPHLDCSYRNALYPQGYTFRGRIIGHTLGGDGRMLSLGSVLARNRNESWTLLARHIELNRAGVEPEPSHPVSSVPRELKNLELQYNRAFAWGELLVGLSLEEERGHGTPRGFLQWRRGF